MHAFNRYFYLGIIPLISVFGMFAFAQQATNAPRLSDLRPKQTETQQGNPLLSQTQNLRLGRKKNQIGYVCKNSIGQTFQTDDVGYENCLHELNRQKRVDRIEEPAAVKIPGPVPLTVPQGFNKVQITIEK